MTLSTHSRGSDVLPTRRDPYREIEDAWARMTHLLDGVFGGPRHRSLLSSVTLPADVEETDDGFVVEIDLPGARRDDISVELSDTELVVTGEIKERERKGVVRHGNRVTGRFEHRVTLPCEVDPETVDAALAHGVLTVRLAKTRRSQARHVEVRTEASGGSGDL